MKYLIQTEAWSQLTSWPSSSSDILAEADVCVLQIYSAGVFCESHWVVRQCILDRSEHHPLKRVILLLWCLQV